MECVKKSMEIVKDETSYNFLEKLEKLEREIDIKILLLESNEITLKEAKCYFIGTAQLIISFKNRKLDEKTFKKAKMLLETCVEKSEKISKIEKFQKSKNMNKSSKKTNENLNYPKIGKGIKINRLKSHKTLVKDFEVKDSISLIDQERSLLKKAKFHDDSFMKGHREASVKAFRYYKELAEIYSNNSPIELGISKNQFRAKKKIIDSRFAFYGELEE
ncbi:hypothetical protein MHBO_003150 [Bonamia ostreae]|uniref:Uncharacterized protein n=1 Tax=Bonamia ostreae TaxID=126728 RepID=A0ABV2AQD1_9EUKA